MTENRRIALNIIATYGRSLFALVCGLFTGRWVLMSLGQSDYGLYGLIVGLTAFIAFFNSLLGGAVGRFYAFSVGEAKVTGDRGLENCREWFNTALLIHTVVPLILIAIGYPLGAHAITHGWLVIPPDRVQACVWVFRFVCVSCFVGMVTVPFSAMYQAKQYIAELTIYSVVSTAINVCFLAYMITHPEPGYWLTRLALWSCILAVGPTAIIAIRAYFIFPECRFRPHYLWSPSRIKSLGNFAGWQMFGCLGSMLRGQGIQVLINRFFGAIGNASMSVGQTLSGHCDTLSGSMIGAFSPAITNACGAKDYDRMRTLAYQTCKLGTLFTLIFALPLALEVKEVLRLWLVTPPDYAAGLCLCILAQVIIDKTAVGHMLAVNAKGKVALYQFVLGGALLLTLPLAWLFLYLGHNIYLVGLAMILTMMACAWGRVWFARSLVEMSARYWLMHIFLPLGLLILSTCALGMLPRLFMAPSFWRICVTTAITELTLLGLAWAFLLTTAERDFVLVRLTLIKAKIFR